MDLPEFNMAGQQPDDDELNTIVCRLQITILLDF